MATATNSASSGGSVTNSNNSPRSSGDPVPALNSPQSRRTVRGSSAWGQVHRDGEIEPITSLSPSPSPSPSAASAAALAPAPASPSSSATLQEQTNVEAASSSSPSPEDSAVEAQPESSDYGAGTSNAGRRPAWNRPSNGAIEVGPVMGAVSWPALSESARASPKSSSSESLKALSDGSTSISQGTVIAASSSERQNISININPSPTPNHVPPTRQRSMRRGSGSSSGGPSANGGFPQPQSPPPPPLPPLSSPAEVTSNNAGITGSVVLESSPRDNAQRGGSQSHGGNDHAPQHNTFRRGNGGPHPRGDGLYHHNYGGRRDQDRGNHDWNHHRSFNGREANMQPQRVPRAFIRAPPPPATPYIPPQPMPIRAFGSTMVYPEVPSSVIYVAGPPAGVPIVGPTPMPSHMYFPVSDPPLPFKIVNQIDYYFSNENIIKDTYLRKNMDDQGWVPIKLIAGFKKVRELTDNIQLILEAVRTSTIVEVQGDRVRRRNDWMRWIMRDDMLAANIHNVTLEENTMYGRPEALLSRSFSGDLISQSRPSSGEGTSQGSVQPGSEHSILARSSSK